MQEMMGDEALPVTIEVENNDGTYSAVETHIEKNTSGDFEEELILEEYSITRKR
jgi:hypothetical protein